MIIAIQLPFQGIFFDVLPNLPVFRPAANDVVIIATLPDVLVKGGIPSTLHTSDIFIGGLRFKPFHDFL